MANKENIQRAILLRTETVEGRELGIYYEGPIVPRSEALENGASTFFNAVPCVRNHISQRRTGNSACIVCERLKRKGELGPPLAPAIFTGTADNMGQSIADKLNPPPETEKPETEGTKAPAAFINKDFSNRFIAMAIVLRLKKPYAAKDLQEEAEAIKGEPIPYSTMALNLAKWAKLGLIERVKHTTGNAHHFRTHPNFFEDVERRGILEKIIEHDKAHEDLIRLNFQDAKRLYGKSEETVKEVLEEDALIADIDLGSDDDLVLESAPTALIGRAIVDYIAKLRSNADYDKYKAKIDDLRQAAHRYRTQYEEAISSTKRAVLEGNELKRENHDLKVKISQLENLNQQMQRVIDRGIKGTFTLREVAKIKSTLGALGANLDTEGGENASQH